MKKKKINFKIPVKNKNFPMIIIKKEDVMKNSLRNYEIDRIQNLLMDNTLRGFERYSLEIYLKSLKEDGKQQ